MIRLHQFAPALGLPSASPFCMKLEGWLRLALSRRASFGALPAPLRWIERLAASRPYLEAYCRRMRERSEAAA